jgi:hypothetical protein
MKRRYGKTSLSTDRIDRTARCCLFAGILAIDTWRGLSTVGELLSTARASTARRRPGT